MKKCPQTITIPQLIENECPNGQISTDCTIYTDAITYLSLPPNSTTTEVIDALLTSLADARNRLEDVEEESEVIANKQNSLDEDGTGVLYPTVDAVNEGLALKADDDSVLHNTGINNLDGRLVIVSTLNTALTVFSPDSDAINALTEEPTGVALFAQNSGGGDIAKFNNFVDGDVVTINNDGDITANSFIKEGGLSTEFLMADGSVSLGGGGGLPYSSWRARINSTGVVAVFEDGIGFTSPVITNPNNGEILITKTGFFTGIDPNTVDLISETMNNSGTPFVTTLNRWNPNPNNAVLLNIFDMTGVKSSTPSTTVVVEIRIYN